MGTHLQKFVVRNSSCSNKQHFVRLKFLCKYTHPLIVCMSSAFHLQTDNFTTFFKNKIYFEITFTPVIQIISVRYGVIH